MNKPFILVVDDNKITTKLLRRYLEANGYDVQEAYDGIDCVEKVEVRKPDAIVLDVMMPRLDGYETAKKLKSQDHTKLIPIVIVTALNDVANQLKSVEMGADDFLSKPIEEKLLIAKVKMLSTISINGKKALAMEKAVQDFKDGKIDLKNTTTEAIYEAAGL